MLRVGIPREIKSGEKRVGLVPADAAGLCRAGITVFLEHDAGAASGFADEAYRNAGVEIVPDADALYRRADLIQKVKEPLEPEFARLRRGQYLFGFLHLASPAQCGLVRALKAAEVTAIGFETVIKDGRLPILAPMSEIAGGLAALCGLYFCKADLRVQKNQKLFAPETFKEMVRLTGEYPHLPANLPARRAVIYGGGVAGRAALEVLLKAGSQVTLIERNPQVRTALRAQFSAAGGRLVLAAPEDGLTEDLRQADLLIGCVHVPGRRALQVLSAENLKAVSAAKTKIILDIAIDQGGNFPEARSTTWAEPLYVDSLGNLRFAVPNIPAMAGKHASEAISRAALPYTRALALDPAEAFRQMPELEAAVNLRGGKICRKEIQEAHQA